MRILVVGSGGREHVLAWKLRQSKLADKIFCAPGNGGIAKDADCIDIKTDDISSLIEFARKEKIDLTVVGPEAPLALGIVDEFSNYKLRIFGPDKKAAQLEASKVFAKELMIKYGVPTAVGNIFDNPSEAKKYIERKGVPCVVKADGLAQGKGVVVAKTVAEALQAVEMIMEKKIFGDSGKRIIIEDCLEGQEVSIIVITDSKKFIPLASSQDHKRSFDNDQGPNTGGMGAYSPAPIVNSTLLNEIFTKIISAVIAGLLKEGIEYKGALYAGLMLTKEGPKVLEFNVRFGDPETQAILPRLKTDLLEVMLVTTEGRLSRIKDFSWDERACVCVVCAAAGYPGDYEKGKEIFGLEEVAKMDNIFVFHAGTKRQNSKIFTNGGRVLGVTGLGNSIKDAISRTYEAVEKISFSGMHYRKDIGKRAVN